MKQRSTSARRINIVVRACAVLVSVAAAFLLPARALATAHELTWADGTDVTSLNPLLPSITLTELNRLSMAFLARDVGGHVVPELAARVPSQQEGDISNDGKTVTVHLRGNLRWSDGEPLTVSDIAFTINRLNDNTTLVPSRLGFDNIRDVDTITSTTIVLHLAHPDPYLSSELFCDPGLPILPKHLLDGVDINNAPYMDLPVGAGPFRYTRFVRGNYVRLDVNPYFHGAPPKLHTITYKMLPNVQSTTLALRSRAIDFWPQAAKVDAERIGDDASIRARVRTSTRPSVLYFNTASVSLSDTRVRAALRLSLDRRSLILRALHGGATLTESIVSPDDPAYLPLPLVPFNAAKARQLLDSAGWRTQSDGVRMKDGVRLALAVVGVADVPAVGTLFELIRSNWAAIGVSIETRFYPPSILFGDDERGIFRSGKFDVGVYAFSPIRAQLLPTRYRCSDAAPGGADYTRLCDSALDALSDTFDATSDPKRARETLRALQKRLDELVPFIVYGSRDVYDLASDAVAGLDSHVHAPFIDILTMDVVR